MPVSASIFFFSKEGLEGLLRLKISVSQIAEVFQVSRPVVYKAIANYNLKQSRYSHTSEADIQHAVSAIKDNHPNAGEVMLQGHLRASGINAQRRKIRKAISDLNPSVSTRKRPAIQRRVYSGPYQGRGQDFSGGTPNFPNPSHPTPPSPKSFSGDLIKDEITL